MSVFFSVLLYSTHSVTSPSTALSPANVHLRNKQGQTGENCTYIAKPNQDGLDVRDASSVIEWKLMDLCVFVFVVI